MQIKKLSKRLSALLLASAVALPALQYTATGNGFAAAMAQEAGKKEEPRKTKPSQVIKDQKLGKIMQETVALMEAEKYADALKMMATIPPMDKLTSYERAKVHQINGSIHVSQGNYKKALTSFLAMLKEVDLPDVERSQGTLNVAQLYMADGNYVEGVKLLEGWFKTAVNPAPNAYFLLCQGNLQMENYKKALKPCLDTVKVAQERGLDLKEPWFRALIVSYQQNNDLVNATDWVKKAIVTFPKREYWIQLVSLLSQRGMEMDEFAAYRLAWRMGLLNKDTELVRLASLYQFHNIPAEGSKILQKSLDAGIVKPERKTLELLANSYLLARNNEKAEVPLAKAAALADDGKLWLRLAQLYMQGGQWVKASDALGKAVARGGHTNIFRVRVLEGMALVNSDQYDKALKVFADSAKYAETEADRKSVAAWLRFVEDERRRFNDLKEFKLKRYASAK